MERHLRDARPTYALVVWPDASDPEQPSCIDLRGVQDAVAFGAVLIAIEDAEFCCPRPRVRVDPALLRVRPHPYRHDADWRNSNDEGD